MTLICLHFKHFLAHHHERQEALLPQRNSASAAHVYLYWLTDRAVH